ncbi:MAG: T9SS type A sorting domain-containing protein [Saprospiraceae bacterium]|nr:T9SS type A sorting domain-containing protein [Saprospiraceae bacterium]
MKYTLTVLFVLSLCMVQAQNEINWNPAIDLANSQFGNAHPRVAIDGSGNAILVWGRMSDQSVMFSRWTGNNFSTPAKLNPSGLTVASANWMGPEIASKGDTIYIVVKRTPENIHTNRLFLFRSFNGGITFSTPQELAFIADSFSRFPTVAIDQFGNPQIAYMKFNPSFLDSRWVVSKSKDFGLTFESDIKASGWGASAEVCDCCPGVLNISDNKSVIVYRDNNKNLRDIWAGISEDESESFTSGVRVDNNNWLVNICPASGPDAVIIGDTLYTVFMSGKNGLYRNYISKASHNFEFATTVNSLTGSIPGLGQQNFPRISTDGNALAVVWKQNIGNQTQLPILFTKNLSTGFSNNYTLVDSDHITNVDVAMHNGRIYVVWQDDNSGTIKFRSGTYETINTEENPSVVNSLKIFPNPNRDEVLFESDEQFDCMVQIYNGKGELVLTTQSNSNGRIPIRHFQNGVYYLTIQSSFGQWAVKILKLD